jgi:hypothetical protein
MLKWLKGNGLLVFCVVSLLILIISEFCVSDWTVNGNEHFKYFLVGN